MAEAATEPTRRALGLMSGTSMDGLDLALVDTDGQDRFTPLATLYHPYPDPVRALLAASLPEAAGMTDRAARPARVAAAEAAVTGATRAAVAAFLAAHRIDPATIDVIGMHGQTVLHAPGRGLTVQLGEAAAIADAFGVPVVHDFRAADMAAGGEGAPLVPVFHRLLARRAGIAPPVVLANFGGVANITFIGREGALIACDTGPASAMLDDLMQACAGVPFDRDGGTAARGRVDGPALSRLLADPYFERPAPKSLDRNAFDPAPVAGLELADAAATLTAFSARAFARALSLLPERPLRVVAFGGGANNPVLMDAVAEASGLPVETGRLADIDGDFVEAEAFAYLAVRSLAGLPLTFPGTTGVARPVTGGVLARPAARAARLAS